MESWFLLRAASLKPWAPGTPALEWLLEGPWVASHHSVPKPNLAAACGQSHMDCGLGALPTPTPYPGQEIEEVYLLSIYLFLGNFKSRIASLVCFFSLVLLCWNVLKPNLRHHYVISLVNTSESVSIDGEHSLFYGTTLPLSHLARLTIHLTLMSVHSVSQIQPCMDWKYL